MSRDGPPSSVDDVRSELRRLGYLDSGLERFVLGGAAPGTPLRACLATAVRVGLVGGLLAASALLLAALSLDRRLLSEPRDLLVLALYLAVLLALSVGLLAFLGGLLAVWLERRRGRAPHPGLARQVGLGVGLLATVYVAFWWRSHAQEAPLAAQVAALALGLGLSLALGRFASLGAVAVLSAAGRPEDLPQAREARRHFLPLLALAGLIVAATVATASWLAERPRATPEFAVVPTGLRVRVVGIDGLEARMAERLMGEGELPHLRSLMARGAAARLVAEPERVPAIVWTTLATGRGPEAHGIQSTGARRLAGMRTPVAGAGRLLETLGTATDLLRLTRPAPPSAVLRGAKTFWNVASEKGLRVGIVNWWATWPADAVNGYVVSDRTLFKLENGGPAEREVQPAEAFEPLRGLLPAEEGDRARRLDRFAARAALALRRERPPDLEAVYLPGLDIVSMQQMDTAAAADLATLDARLQTVRAHYAFVDGLLGEFLESLAPGELLVLVGDPGRLARLSPGGAEGLLVLAGEAVEARPLGRVGERDLAPTLLHLVGLPKSRELSGRVLDAALAASFRTAHPVREVESYGRRTHAGPRESGFDRQMLEELRSLGYIQ